MKHTHKLIKETIINAVKAQTECYITFKKNSVKLLSYRWATELHSILKFQTKLSTGLEDVLILEAYHVCHVDEKKVLIEQGSVVIEWGKVQNASINEHGDRILIEIDGLEINFLEPIK